VRFVVVYDERELCDERKSGGRNKINIHLFWREKK
jgi:hypothetical protein